MNKRRRFKAKRARRERRTELFLNARNTYWKRRGYQTYTPNLRELAKRFKEMQSENDIAVDALRWMAEQKIGEVQS